MARDTDEELRRLEQALLDEEHDEQDDATDTQDNEELPEILPEEDPYIPNAGVYQNYSNDYGKKLRNYATGYRAYNSDKTDADLEEFSEEVLESNTSGGGCVLALIAIILAIGIIGVLVYGYLFTRGYIG